MLVVETIGQLKEQRSIVAHEELPLLGAEDHSVLRGSIEAQRRNGLLLTRRWRETDSNLRFLDAPYGFPGGPDQPR
jgi:hypothetical protein